MCFILDDKKNVAPDSSTCGCRDDKLLHSPQKGNKHIAIHSCNQENFSIFSSNIFPFSPITNLLQMKSEVILVNKQRQLVAKQKVDTII